MFFIPGMIFSLPKKQLTLKETYDRYIEAVQKRDLKPLMSTVTEGKDFTFLPSSGRVISSPEGYSRFHIRWFSYPDWTIEFKLEEWCQSAEYGYFRTWYRYREKDKKGVWHEEEAYFTLIFHKEANGWKVVYDQITPIHK
ncbi:MAG: nuclear transport factor 2 family protein [Acidobacteria bacterium]|nr:nuclear transport factor 2 family protein [Acidobacteriota bacterium]